MQKQDIPWEAISARLKNGADEMQMHQIQDWLDSSPENSAILTEIIDVWSVTKSNTVDYYPDLAANWEKLQEKTGNKEQVKNRSMVYLRYAAAVVLLALAFVAGTWRSDYWHSDGNKSSLLRIVAPEGSKVHIVLPDSTRVWLNSGSELVYSSNFSSKNREVSMKGECFFDVSKDAVHPFVVNSSNFSVHVFGTRFNINESVGRSSSNITLISGQVQVFGLDGKFVSGLTPGNQLVFENGTCNVRPAANLDVLGAWTENLLIFDGQPFEDVIRYLEKWYGVKIHFDRTLYYGHNYTFKVKTESLREVLELISVITPIEYRIEGDSVTIKYKKKTLRQ